MVSGQGKGYDSHGECSPTLPLTPTPNPPVGALHQRGDRSLVAALALVIDGELLRMFVDGEVSQVHVRLVGVRG